ncbi:hypothetical protein Tco_1198330 [Tanacetum coccineum]
MLKVRHDDFVVKERLLWIEFEGVPLRAWNQSTFKQIASRWGDLLFLDDADETNRFSMRLGVKTTHAPLVFESIALKMKRVKILLMITTVDMIRKVRMPLLFILFLILLQNAKGTTSSHRKRFLEALGRKYELKPHNTNTEDEVLVEDSIQDSDLRVILLINQKGDGEAPSKDMRNVDVIHTTPVHVWGNTFCDFSSSPARGRSEGILCIWNKLVYQKSKVFCCENDVVVEGEGVYYGPSLFWFFNSWLDMEGFHELVVETWKNDGICEFIGMVNFKKKLQNLKCVLHKWNISNRANLNAARMKHLDRVAAIDVLVDQGLAFKVDLVMRNESLKILSDLDRPEAKDLAQKAKVKWAVEPVDKNTKIFFMVS